MILLALGIINVYIASALAYSQKSPIHQSFAQRSDYYKAISVPKFLVDLFDTLTLDFGL